MHNKHMSKILPLSLYPAFVLRQKARELTTQELQSASLSQLLLAMEKTMEANDGIGLAAPQIGKSIRLAIVKTKDGILPLLNPKIIKKSLRKELDTEGCLSIPGVFGTVKRHLKIKVQTINLDGKIITIDAQGLFARVIQHEIDHLNGVLFIDKAQEITEGAAVLHSLKENTSIVTHE